MPGYTSTLPGKSRTYEEWCRDKENQQYLVPQANPIQQKPIKINQELKHDCQYQGREGRYTASKIMEDLSGKLF